MDSEILAELKKEKSVLSTLGMKVDLNKEPADESMDIEDVVDFLISSINDNFKTEIYTHKSVIINDKSLESYLSILSTNILNDFENTSSEVKNFIFTVDNYYENNNIWHFYIVDFFNSNVNKKFSACNVKYRVNAKFFTIDSTDAISVVIYENEISKKNSNNLEKEISIDHGEMIKSYLD